MTRAVEIARLLRESKIYDLGMEFYVGMTRNLAHPPFMFSLLRLHADAPHPGTSGAACVFSLGGHTGTHLDALGHFAKDGKVYGYGDLDVRQNESPGGGLRIGGIETTPPIVRRGILLDIAGLHRVPVLAGDHEIGAQDLQGAVEAQQVSVQKGDVILVRTGWIQCWREQTKYDSPAPGVNNEGAGWIIEQACSLTGSDTSAFEKIDRTMKEVHIKILAEGGIQIMETLNLEQLAKDRCYEFLFVALPLKIRGATGSPIRPIAISC